MNVKYERWCGHDIRFVEHEDEWWAILKDICDALKLRTNDVAQRLDPKMMSRVQIAFDTGSNGIRSRGHNKSRTMIVVNELGIYEALFASKRPEAKQLRRWTATILQRLRKHVGLQGHEVMRMTETEVQEEINRFLDDIFYDEETKKLMTSRTVPGGDVEVYELEEQDLFNP